MNERGISPGAAIVSWSLSEDIAGVEVACGPTEVAKEHYERYSRLGMCVASTRFGEHTIRILCLEGNLFAEELGT